MPWSACSRSIGATSPAQTGVIATLISFETDGEQYVTVVAGWSGAFALTAAAAEGYKLKSRGRILTYKLGGQAELPPVVDVAAVLPEPPPIGATDEEIAHGEFCKLAYQRGFAGGASVCD